MIERLNNSTSSPIGIILNRADKNIYLSIALASIDDKHDIAPIAHAYVDSKASWYHPSTKIPSFSEIPDGALD